MRWTAIVGMATAIAMAGVLGPSGVATSKPSSFHRWTLRWSAQAERDNTRVMNRCRSAYGSSDLKFGMCFIKAGRANLRAERALWETQVAKVVRGQSAACKRAIYRLRERGAVEQMASLAYLDSHGRTTLSRIATDIAGEPYATLRSLSDDARARAVAICG